jgi:CRAL/TRIO domain
VISPLLDAAVAEKIKFISRNQLSEFIEPSQTPKSFGGSNDYTFTYTSPDTRERINDAEYQAVRLALLRGSSKLVPYVTAWAYRTVTERKLSPILPLADFNLTGPAMEEYRKSSAHYYVADSSGRALPSGSEPQWNPKLATMPLDQLNELRLNKEREYIHAEWQKYDSKMRFPSVWQRHNIIVRKQS